MAAILCLVVLIQPCWGRNKAINYPKQAYLFIYYLFLFILGPRSSARAFPTSPVAMPTASLPYRAPEAGNETITVTGRTSSLKAGWRMSSSPLQPPPARTRAPVLTIRPQKITGINRSCVRLIDGYIAELARFEECINKKDMKRSKKKNTATISRSWLSLLKHYRQPSNYGCGNAEHFLEARQKATLTRRATHPPDRRAGRNRASPRAKPNQHGEPMSHLFTMNPQQDSDPPPRRCVVSAVPAEPPHASHTGLINAFNANTSTTSFGSCDPPCFYLDSWRQIHFLFFFKNKGWVSAVKSSACGSLIITQTMFMPSYTWSHSGFPYILHWFLRSHSAITLSTKTTGAQTSGALGWRNGKGSPKRAVSAILWSQKRRPKELKWQNMNNMLIRARGRLINWIYNIFTKLLYKSVGAASSPVCFVTKENNMKPPGGALGHRAEGCLLPPPQNFTPTHTCCPPPLHTWVIPGPRPQPSQSPQPPSSAVEDSLSAYIDCPAYYDAWLISLVPSDNLDPRREITVEQSLSL